MKNFMPFIFSKFGDIWAKHNRSILIGIGIGSMAGGAIIAVAETPKAMANIDVVKKELKVDRLSKWEIVKASWKYYILPTSLELVGAGCIVASHIKSEQRGAALAAAATLYGNSYTELKEKIQETLGENKTKAIEDSISKDKASQIEPSDTLVVDVNEGSTLVMEGLTNHLYYYTIEKIRAAEHELNALMFSNDGEITVNDYLDAVHLPRISVGDDLRWNFDITSNARHEKFKIKYFSGLIGDDKTPVLIFQPELLPSW